MERGFVINLWQRYFKEFTPYLRMNCLDRDLSQTIELAAVKIRQVKNLTEASRIVQREFRAFLKDVGYRKVSGRYVVRELLFDYARWEVFNKTGRFLSN